VTTTEGQQLTGISDTVFNLGSVFYHAAEGGQVYAKYIEDAEREGDQELVEFFREIQQQDAKRAQKAKQLISRR
jgi:rubrerythrin